MELQFSWCLSSAHRAVGFITIALDKLGVEAQDY